MVTATHPTKAAGELAERARAVAAQTPDPELPMVTVADLGILRDVTLTAGRYGPGAVAAGGSTDTPGVTVTITPTYSGCPAMREISADIAGRLERAGFAAVTVRTQLAPPWSSDWITADGRRKLAAAGIAPPPAAPSSRAGEAGGRAGPVPLDLGLSPALGRVPGPACPRCGSPRTRRTAAFSATACKALFRCDACDEPFEGVKPL